MSNRYVSTTVDETEDDVSANVCILHLVIVTNPSTTDMAYLKLWDGVASGIDPASDAADLVFGVPPQATIPCWLGESRFANGCCIGATAEAGVGNTAPDSDLVVTLFRD